MLGPNYMDLTVKQIQDSVGLTNMSNPKNLNITDFKIICLILNDLLQYKY
jgi:hypothetical protein